MKPFLMLRLPLLLYHLLLVSSLGNACLKDCVCVGQDTTFCSSRRDTRMPTDVPATIKKLYVFKNGIEILSEEDFEGYSNLEMLDISQNKLTELPDGVFRPLSSLHNLDLSSNQIVHITQDSFAGLEHLERLYLFSNLIESIDSTAFDGLEQLLELKLQGNKLTMMPALKMPHLLLLDLGFNSIPSLDPDNLHTPKLESLKLGGLGLKILNEELLESFSNLHELDISGNHLTVFPPILREAKGMVSLSLAGNPMGPVNWEDFEKMVELQELDISNLSLQGLPESLKQLFPHLNKLTVAENPFNCLCNLAWFPSWLRLKQIQLGRTKDTRCHFPPLNSGKELEQLGHGDFGCPTTKPVKPRIVKTTVVPPVGITTSQRTTHAVLHPKPSDNSSTKISNDPPPTPSASIEPDLRSTTCPSNICLNGGTCWLDHQGDFQCICLPETSGTYCENEEDILTPEDNPTEFVIVDPEIAASGVTISSIVLDLHRYIDMRPHIPGVRLTYRNLSGPDKRPKTLNVPPSYPEYTLRGLQANSTYSVCASPLNEPEDIDSTCTEAQTMSQQPSRVAASPKLTTMLIPAVAILLLLILVAVAVGIACYMQKKKSKGHLDLQCDPSQLELEGVDIGALPQKQEIFSCPPAVQNGGLDYEVPLMQDYCTANNNTSGLKPSYF